MSRPAQQRTNESGFTLIETLVALALMGLVLSALANLTAQWLPNWNRGLDRIQRSELIGIALQRIADDLAAAQYVPASRGESPAAVRGLRAVGDLCAHGAWPERRSRARRGASRRNHRQGRACDGPFANGVPSVAARSVVFRSAAFRRARGAVACAVPAVLCLCRRRPCMAKQLARSRQVAGEDQADRARRVERRVSISTVDVHSRPVVRARRCNAGRRAANQSGAQQRKFVRPFATGRRRAG